MARIPYADPEAPENREAAAHVVASRGKLGHLRRMLPNSRPIARGWIDLYDAVRWKTELPGKLREMAMCQVAAINGARYEWAAHAPIALEEGATRAQLDALPDRAARRELFDAAAFDSVFSMLRTTGKQPPGLQKFVPGYVANRIQAAIGLEVQNLPDEGVATAPEIDAAIIHGLAPRLPVLGFYAKADFTGLPLMQGVARNKSYVPPVPKGGSPVLDRLVEEGRTGVPAGAGYYDRPGDPAALFEARDRRLIQLKQAMREIGTMAGLERGA